MRTLAIIPNWLGDAVMALPALEHLRDHSDELVGLGVEPLGELLMAGGVLDRHLAYDRRGRHAGPSGWGRIIRRLRAENFDRAVAFPPSERAALLARFSGARERWGIASAGREFLLTHTREGGLRQGEHLVDQWSQLVAGRGALERCPSLEVSERHRARAGALLEEAGIRGVYAALSPTATYGPTKRWPPARYREVARYLRKSYGIECVLVAGGTAAEVELCQELSTEPGVHSLAGRTDLVELAAVLAGAHLFVGNDSGPMHLAAAVGTATVGIFTSTDPEWTGPRGKLARAAGPPDLFCSPCFLARCPYGLECLELVSFEEVRWRVDWFLTVLAGEEGQG